jgi:hypothetical protein
VPSCPSTIENEEQAPRTRHWTNNKPEIRGPRSKKQSTKYKEKQTVSKQIDEQVDLIGAQSSGLRKAQIEIEIVQNIYLEYLFYK